MTVLIDTSVWVEYFRGTGSPTVAPLRDNANSDIPFRTCGPVSMEVLAGARNVDHLNAIVRVLERGADIPLSLRHFEDAAAIYRTCRGRGITVRSMVDCLIAAIAMSEDMEILHKDRDFGAIASVFPLRIHPASMN